MPKNRFGKLWYWVFDSTEFSSTEKLVFAALCMYQDSENCCFPSVRELMRVSSLGKTSVSAALKRLETLGAITRSKRWKGLEQTSNFYQLLSSPSEPYKEESEESIEFTKRTQRGSPNEPKQNKRLTEKRKGETPRVFNISGEKVVQEIPPIGDFEKLAKDIINEIESEA